MLLLLAVIINILKGGDSVDYDEGVGVILERHRDIQRTMWEDRAGHYASEGRSRSKDRVWELPQQKPGLFKGGLRHGTRRADRKWYEDWWEG